MSALLEDKAAPLYVWTFFEGVPKFYHDAFEQRLFEIPAQDLARELLVRMFLRGSSPLSEEADTWFLRELRGRSVSILHYLADHPGCNHAQTDCERALRRHRVSNSTVLCNRRTRTCARRRFRCALSLHPTCRQSWRQTALLA